MAAPTDPRVEANSPTSVTLFWVYGGSVGVAVHRSTDGMSYAEVAVVAAAALTYNDIGLSAGTKYWYKLSDDSGATFSDVVTVWTHGCIDVGTGGDAFSLPRFPDESPEEQQARLDEQAQRIEDVLQGRVLNPQECGVCPEDGAIVVSCTDGCRDFVVIADEDINSISIQMCEEGQGNIEFIIPPNVTRAICGWPSGFGFGGDECFRAPIVSGAAGRSMSVPYSGGGRAGSGRAGPPKSRPGYGGGIGRGGMGGTVCTCVTGKSGQLTIKSCNPNNSLLCSSTKKLELVACGGKGPYTWSKTGTIELSRTTGDRISVTPPTNAGSAVVGKAYSKAIFGVGCGHSLGTTHPAGQTKASYNCDDSLITCPDGVVGGTATVLAFLDSSCSCAEHSGHDVSGAGAIVEVSCSNLYATGAECDAAKAIGSITDHRTAGMISDGCAPCGLAANGATVSVTDAAGVVATIILKA